MIYLYSFLNDDSLEGIDTDEKLNDFITNNYDIETELPAWREVIRSITKSDTEKVWDKPDFVPWKSTDVYKYNLTQDIKKFRNFEAYKDWYNNDCDTNFKPKFENYKYQKIKFINECIYRGTYIKDLITMTKADINYNAVRTYCESC